MPDNPDQRIAEDVRLFVEQSMLLGTGFVVAVAQLLSRLPMLLLLSPTKAFGQRLLVAEMPSESGFTVVDLTK